MLKSDRLCRKRSEKVRVRLLQSGLPVASGVVDRISDDGIHVSGMLPQLDQGTYVEVELFNRSLGHIGAMVERRSSNGVSLVYASWSPQLFDLILRFANGESSSAKAFFPCLAEPS